MLACARIGAPHSVIFAGFSSDAIRDQILDADCHYVITCGECHRGKKVTALKEIVDAGLKECPEIKKVFVWQKNENNNPCNMMQGRDFNLNQEMRRERPYCPCELMDSEDILFLLYTSGGLDYYLLFFAGVFFIFVFILFCLFVVLNI